MNKLLKQTEFYIALVIILLCIVITIFNPRFLTAENIFDLLKSFSVIGIMAVGVLFILILSGSPDVSFTAIAQVVEYVVVIMTLKWGGNIFFSFLVAAALGTLMGSFNGILVHYFRVPTVIITIATLNIYYGLLYVFSKGEVIFVVHPMFREFANIKIGNFVNDNNVTYGFTLMPLIWILVLILGWYILKYTSVGRNIYAIGGNEVAAERVGINVFRTKLFAFSFIGLLSGIAAIVHAAIVQSAIPNIIVGQELNVIAAVFLGGASVFGGGGSIIGTFLGIMLFAIMNNGLTLLKISTYWFNVFVGAVIVISITISAVQKIRQQKSRIKVHVDERVVERA
ncbi:MAG: ABC transporter permease [Candidatus Atribacteria bacterium]|nr:ABC transporter permease [Candidatus Atribacteria bacterium]